MTDGGATAWGIGRAAQATPSAAAADARANRARAIMALDRVRGPIACSRPARVRRTPERAPRLTLDGPGVASFTLQPGGERPMRHYDVHELELRRRVLDEQI